MTMFVTRGNFDSSVFREIGEKSVLVQTFCELVFCSLKLASEITAAATTKKKTWKALVCISPTFCERHKKEMSFF